MADEPNSSRFMSLDEWKNQTEPSARRPSGRQANQMRPITFKRGYTAHAEGSVLVSFGQTKVLCTASVEQGVPRFLKGKGEGWVTAEYGMLPRSTHDRMGREAARGKQSGRTLEIQRLIGRSLRACLDLTRMKDYTITLDCDVLQADGGTRTAAISGAWVALNDAIQSMVTAKKIKRSPIISQVAAVSIGLKDGEALLDLDYLEDSSADTDMNVVMNSEGGLIEVQGTAEGAPFSREDLNKMLDLAESGINAIVAEQNKA